MEDYSYQKTDTLLTVSNVSLNLGGKLILRDINFEIKKTVRPGKIIGEVVSLLAPSGMGKTQLFNLLGGILKPNTGEIKLMHENAMHNVEIGQVGIVQQAYPLFNQMTIEQNLNVAAKSIPKSERENRINYFLDHFCLQDKRKLYPAELSGGQRQRISIAQQMICSRNLLLLDEPTSGLDAISTDAVARTIIDIANLKENQIIFVVSHDVSTACSISDVVLLLGREKDEQGNFIPGAKIMKEYDLAELGLAWHEDIRTMPEFLQFTSQIREEFKNL